MERISFCRYIQQSQQYSINQKGKDSFTLESKSLLRPKPSKGMIGLGGLIVTYNFQGIENPAVIYAQMSMIYTRQMIGTAARPAVGLGNTHQ